MHAEHVPVLADEVIRALNIQPAGSYLDGTYGRGGHSELILSQLNEQGRLLVIDRDPAAIAAAKLRHGKDPRVLIEHGVFADVGQLAAKHNMHGGIAGCLLDLGVSSPQLDQASRGFSFSKDGDLDMRMNPEEGLSAAEWLQSVDERELASVLRRFGEERQATRIARAIVQAGAEKPLKTTTELADAVLSVVRPRPGKIHPATKTFQAIRIATNDELNQVSMALDALLDVLQVGGRMVILAFQSLEDRIVKRFIRTHSEVSAPYRGLPDIPAEHQPRMQPIGKLIRSSEKQIQANPRARSVRMRVAEKVRP
ncbi:MAG: 16S rRNA (cytosine(1402)-N(4))-methyltransferase RsmH [Pseudomonadota bacterium]